MTIKKVVHTLKFSAISIGLSKGTDNYFMT